jgi:hypothetical protein
MKKFLFLSILTMSLFAVSSCDEEVIYEATIGIMSPGEGLTMDAGDNVHLHINFDNADIIHHVQVTITREHDGEVVYDTGEIHADADQHYEHHGDYVIETMMHSDFTVEARTWDHDAEEPLIATRSFHAHP